jgi:hypothetical protein
MPIGDGMPGALAIELRGLYDRSIGGLA